MSTSELIDQRWRRRLRAAGISEPYQITVKLVDGSRRTYEFRTWAAAEDFWLTAWRKTRTGPTPTSYSVAIEEHDGHGWHVTRQSLSSSQIRARHQHLAATLH